MGNIASEKNGKLKNGILEDFGLGRHMSPNLKRYYVMDLNPNGSNLGPSWPSGSVGPKLGPCCRR